MGMKFLRGVKRLTRRHRTGNVIVKTDLGLESLMGNRRPTVEAVCTLGQDT